jgi:Transcriptional Coactivator p15 (PC4)
MASEASPVARTPDAADRRTAPTDDGVKLGTLSRGPDTELRIRAKEFKGHRFIDVREWSRTAADQDWWPVKGRGVTIKLRELADVIRALEAFE